MRCPHCSVAEIPDTETDCPLCGYSTDKATQVSVLAPDDLDERVRVELGLEFHIERELWRAEESRTYLATEASGKSVSLTIFPRPPGGDASVEARLARVAHHAAQLQHPHIVPTYGSGTSASLFWSTSQYLEARPLRDVLREFGPMDLVRCRRIAEQVGSALDHGHRRGFTHGDVTAACVLVDANDWVFVTHFGLTQAVRGISLTRQGGPSGDQRDLGLLVASCLNLPTDSAAIPPDVMHAIQRAVSPDPAVRFPTILDFVAGISGSEFPAPLPMVVPGPPKRRSLPNRVFMPEPHAPEPSRAKWVIGAVIAALVAALAVILSRPQESRVPVVVRVGPNALHAPSVVRETLPQDSPPIERSDAIRRVPAPPLPQRFRPVGVPAPQEVAPASGQLSVNSTPWGQVYLDGVLLGNTPQLSVAVRAGPHVVRVVREGFQPFERQILVEAGREIRLTDLVLPAR